MLPARQGRERPKPIAWILYCLNHMTDEFSDDALPCRGRRNHPVMSHRQIACVLGISAHRVEEIERRALKKLRREFARRGVTSLDQPGESAC